VSIPIVDWDSACDACQSELGIEAISPARFIQSTKTRARGVMSRPCAKTIWIGIGGGSNSSSTIDNFFSATRAPAGEFLLDHSRRPVVLVSAGIGVTPMVSMLRALVESAESRPVWFVHGARDGANHALADEVRAMAAAREGVRTHVSFSRPLPEDYLCGPIAFMADLQAELEALGVSPDQIHSESFGPA
jgi:Na+-transporting NADH:ubiquinone oxidoreductase subunit NqrF